jgi:hypothetical protein
MYFYPYAAPVAGTLVWTGDTVGVALMVAGLTGVAFVVALAWRSAHQRVVRTVPMISVLSGRRQIPRVAA